MYVILDKIYEVFNIYFFIFYEIKYNVIKNLNTWFQKSWLKIFSSLKCVFQAVWIMEQ